MAEEQNAEEEPSIEEILDSIRQIISDDDGDAAAEEVAEAPAPPKAKAAVPQPPPPAPAAKPEEDVIELTEKVDPEPESEPDPEPVPVPEPKVEKKAPPQPEPQPIEVDLQEMDTDVDDDSLLTAAAESAAYDGFSELAKKTAIQHGGITVEEIVRSELRPLLRKWLDNHLPSIIERLVQEELERVAKRALED